MSRGRRRVAALILGAVTVTLVVAGASASTGTAATSGRWKPHPGATFQIQYAGRLDLSVRAKVYDVDYIDTSKTQVAKLHNRGRHAICYISAGSWEDWRPDADKFPARVLGNDLDGWPGERWLDIRALGVLRPLMRHRMDVCVRKGFDAIDPDNVEGYADDSGFPLSAGDQLRYNRWLAKAAHERDLSIGLKNDLGQVSQLVGRFDFAVNEQCRVYHECGRLDPFVAAHKAVFHIEYKGEWPAERSCNVAGFTSVRKHLNLDAWRRSCR